ncbi:MAG: lipopolysaccharide heptosyltransferase I [Planctomycetota bacterium]
MNAAEPHARPIQRVLIIKPSSLGDIVHALPVLAALRAAYPQAHIAWLVGSTFVPLLADHPLLDEVIPFDRRRYGRMLQNRRILLDFIGFLRQLRSRRFDLVIDLQGLIRSGFMAWASGARQRIGFTNAREGAPLFYTRRVRCGSIDQHAVEKNLQIAAALNLDIRAPQFPLGLTADETTAARKLLHASAGEEIKSFTAILPGGRWPSKLWPAQRWGELIERIHAAGLPRCVLLGAGADRAFSDRIVAACNSTPLDLVGHTTLRELVALLDLAERVVCHDSGPMHIAAALGKPLVAIFGPTNPARTGPYSTNARVINRDLPCTPCYKRTCPLKHHACLRELDTDTVFDRVRDCVSPRRHEATKK